MFEKNINKTIDIKFDLYYIYLNEGRETAEAVSPT